MQKTLNFSKNINFELKKCFLRALYESSVKTLKDHVQKGVSLKESALPEDQLQKQAQDKYSADKLPIILAISGDSKNVDVCVTKGQEVLKAIAIDGSSASKLLVSTIDVLLADVGMQAKDLSHVAVNVGPGSFTSTRVLVVVANALAWATKIPVIPVSSFEVLLEKYNQKQGQNCNKLFRACALNAYSGQVYGTVFDSNNDSVMQALCLNPDKFEAKVNETFGKDNIVWLLDGVKSTQLNNDKQTFDACNYTGFQSIVLAKVAFEKLAKDRGNAMKKVGIDYVKDGFV